LPDDLLCSLFFFIFNHTQTTHIFSLSLHDALPISKDHTVPFRSLMLLAAAIDPRFGGCHPEGQDGISFCGKSKFWIGAEAAKQRSEEHTSELQSRENLVCRLLLEKKKKRL